MTVLRNCCLIGVPDHQAVLHVGGRVGAALGPKAFRRVFSRLKGRAPVHSAIQDLGDVLPLTSDVAENHRRAADAVASAHARALDTAVSILVGGGHDHGYSQLAGIAQAFRQKTVGCINIDAHLDVRKPAPQITSGSPFYLALEAGILLPEHFVEFGIQAHCNAPELWEYVEAKGVQVVPFEKLRHGKAVGAFEKALRRLATSCDVIVISLDLDAAASAYAPGVSAPQTEGFTPTEILEMCEISGREAKAVSLGIFELNPEHDLDDRTARLGATAAWHFVAEKIASQ